MTDEVLHGDLALTDEDLELIESLVDEPPWGREVTLPRADVRAIVDALRASRAELAISRSEVERLMESLRDKEKELRLAWRIADNAKAELVMKRKGEAPPPTLT